MPVYATSLALEAAKAAKMGLHYPFPAPGGK